MITEVTYFKTSDGSLHRTRKIAEDHDKALKSESEKASDLLAQARKRWPDLKTQTQSYRDGYERGLTWPKEWTHRPGGPFCYHDLHTSDEVFRAYGEQTRRNRMAWLRGWQDGVCNNPDAASHLKVRP